MNLPNNFDNVYKNHEHWTFNNNQENQQGGKMENYMNKYIKYSNKTKLLLNNQ